jgi:hypothetical protein
MRLEEWFAPEVQPPATDQRSHRPGGYFSFLSGRVISVIKKRASNHEDTIREYRIATPGIQIGLPLEDFQEVLRGVPTNLGQNTLMK